MRLFKRINCFIDGLGHDIRLFNPKSSLIFGVIALILGIASWIAGGRGDTLLLVYIFPRHVLPLGFMYFMWAVSFFFFGVIVGGMMTGCEKYKRREAVKGVIFLLSSYVFILFVYPVFFRSMAPFIAFLLVFVSIFFCVLAIMASARIYSLWTLCTVLYVVWLTYNGYLSLCIALIN